MTASLIGGSLGEIGYEIQYTGPFCTAIYNTIEKYLEQIEIDKAITSCVPGAEFLWAWSIFNYGLPLTSILSCQNYGENFSQSDKHFLKDIVNNSAINMVLATGSSNPAKENFRDKTIIDRSDLIFVIWNKSPIGRIPNLLPYIKSTDKELILINTNELRP